jgi:hypothetical protein
MDMLDLQLSLRHESRRAKWWDDLHRIDPPPFLGPLLSIKEAAAALARSVNFVRARIDDSRLNTWKDPVSKRVWVLKDDVDLLRADLKAGEADRETRRRGDKETPGKRANPQSAIDNPQSEDLDAIGGWEAPKPPEPRGAAGYLEDQEKEREARYQQKQRQNEEWYAAELANLEDRDPAEAVRQLQIERGWVTSEPAQPQEPPFGTLMQLAAVSRAARPPRKRPESARPISWTDPNARPRTKPEPYIDPDDQSKIENRKSKISCPFPIGWVGWKQAAASLQVSPGYFLKLVRKHSLQRRRAPDGRPRLLYDSIEIEALAEQRLAAQGPPEPGRRIDWWGSRRVKIAINEFDSWITVQQAAHLLGVSSSRISQLCNAGRLPCHQEKPGVNGSRLLVPHHHVLRLRERMETDPGRSAYEKGAARNDSEPPFAQQEDYGIDEFPTRGWSKACQKDYGDEYTTRQAANVLGVGKNAILTLMRRGKLTGCHHPRRGTQKNGCKTWFFKKEQVDALAADPVYRKRHVAWLNGVRRKAGWEV